MANSLLELLAAAAAVQPPRGDDSHVAPDGRSSLAAAASSGVQLTSAHLQDEFFRSLAPTLCAEVCRCLVGRTYSADEVVFLEGTVGETFYIVIEGAVSILQNHQPPKRDGPTVTVQSDGAETLIVRLGRGSSFGELSILGSSDSERRRAASAVAAGPDGAVLGELSRDDYLRLLQKEQRRQLHECVTQLRSVAPFRDVPTLSLTRMAVLMRKNKITITRGETILAQREIPKRLCIFTSGEILIKASGDSSASDETDGAMGALFSSRAGRRKQHELLQLVCGAAAAEIVGESCCNDAASAPRASVATFVAQSARVEGYFLSIEDVGRLTGGGGVRGSGGSRFNKVLAAAGGGSSPLRLALQKFSLERAAQLQQRLGQIEAVSREYHLKEREQQQQQQRRRQQQDIAAPPKGQSRGPRFGVTSASSSSRQLASRPKPGCSGPTRSVDNLGSGRIRGRDGLKQPQAHRVGTSSKTMMALCAAADDTRRRHVVGSRGASSGSSSSGRSSETGRIAVPGSAGSTPSEWQPCETEPEPEAVHRCPSLNSWIEELSYVPATPRQRRRHGRSAAGASPRAGGTLMCGGGLHTPPARSATRVRVTADGVFSVPRRAI